MARESDAMEEVGGAAIGGEDLDQAKRIAQLEAELQQVRKEKDELEDVLVQEQLKNKMPQDARLEAAVGKAAALELELEAMATRCEEWRRRARQKVGDLNSGEVQRLLLEHLEDVDDTGVVALQAEVERLRAELARSEVQRLELYKLQQQGVNLTSPKWEKQEKGLQQQLEELNVGREISGEGCATPKWATPRSSVAYSSQRSELTEDVLSHLLELGEATLASPEGPQGLSRFSSSVEAAELRATEAEKLAQTHWARIQVLEAKLAGVEEERGGKPGAPGAPVLPHANGDAAGLHHDAMPALEGLALAGEKGRHQGDDMIGHHASGAGMNGTVAGHGSGSDCDGEGGLSLSRVATAGSALREESERRGAGEERDLRALLQKVQAQNRTTHCVLGAMVLVPFVVSGFCFFLNLIAKRDRNPNQRGKDTNATSGQSKAQGAASREGPIVLQISSRSGPVKRLEESEEPISRIRP